MGARMSSTTADGDMFRGRNRATPSGSRTAARVSGPAAETKPELHQKLLIGWLVFASVNFALMVKLPGMETIPYHLIWASYALLYGLTPLSRRLTWATFIGVTVFTGVPLVAHAQSGDVDWFECSEIVLMGTLVGLLIWHVDRHRAAQRYIVDLLNDERLEAEQRDLTARFGSHEVRTRLTVARALVEVMRDESSEPAVHADSALVLGEIDKATATAITLLHLVRADAPGQPQAVDLDGLVRQVVERWSAGVDRDWDVTSSVGAVQADPERLEVALDCLIENAVRFTDTSDAIGVAARVEGRDLLISVCDTGAGIPEADRERVFEAFETGSTAGERGRTGLGLALVSALVKARGGSLELTSNVGRGSCFTMRLPLEQLQASVLDGHSAAVA